MVSMVSFLHLHTCVYIICSIFILLPLSLPPLPSHRCHPSPCRTCSALVYNDTFYISYLVFPDQLSSILKSAVNGVDFSSLWDVNSIPDLVFDYYVLSNQSTIGMQFIFVELLNWQPSQMCEFSTYNSLTSTYLFTCIDICIWPPNWTSLCILQICIWHCDSA
jgi:hypothetical protein